MSRPKNTEPLGADSLTDRQREILRLVVQQYVLTANPVGSRFISRISSLGLSDATLRNVMADLEYLGYIDHPHTSAGRMPTDKGYRLYVDSLMMIEQLSEAERKAITRSLSNAVTPADVVRESSSILAKLSKQLSILLLPALQDAILERVEIIPISSNRILIIVAATSGRVRTVTLETETMIDRSKLDDLAYILNSRLAGKTFREVKTIFGESIQDLPEEDRSIFRVFLNSPEKLFEDIGTERVTITGAGNIFNQPEFLRKPNFTDEEVQSIIELIENEEVVIHILERSGVSTIQDPAGMSIRIGSELEDKWMSNYSIVSTTYRIGGQHGTIAVIGPKRMDYARVTPVVDYVAHAMSKTLASR
ncbi:MAG TPA: heat-inducible transcriptional repressor HrcA [Candidatus Kapabacteria bacterium]|nr:heat-inducible transcriptional repressor HrcA [Candidatus Kapabacteria bacterium]